MGYETIHGPSVACPCGQGQAHYPRIEHDTYPSRHPDRWGTVEIECVVCAAQYVTKRGVTNDWYYVPVAEAANWDWSNPDESGFTKVPSGRD